MVKMRNCIAVATALGVATRIMGFKEYCVLIAAIVGGASLLPGCTSALLNSNTLDVATTVDDLATRQIVFNLTRTRENQFALPSQVQISSGQVTADTSLTPGISSPLDPAIGGSINQAATTTTSRTYGLPQVGASLSGSVSAQSSWSINLVQDPEQLRRLRLLYQYGAGQITAKELICQYPIPELPPGQQSTRRYIRMVGNQTINACRPPNVVLVANPDPAFLNFPGCVICAFPNKGFRDLFKQKIDGHKIYESDFSPEAEGYNGQFEYVPVILNNRLLPNSALPEAPDERAFGKIDWLSVLRDGSEPVPDNARRVGGSNGYTVYVYPRSVQPAYGYPGYGTEGPFTGDEHFSEFVLSIIEATLQPAQLEKVGPGAPPLTQTFPPAR